MKQINIAQPQIGPAEKAAVMKVLDSGIIAQGPVVAELETAFAKACGTKHAVAVNSGTAAIHAALFAAGIGPGDEVITTPFSFIATVNPIMMVGATPKFADIDPQDFNLDPNQVEKHITPNTKAIIAVDLYGQPYDYDHLNTIAKKYKLILIDDACQAVGATYKAKKAGGLGKIGCFSLYATKNVVTGEGGMVTTDDDEVVAAVKRFRQHGMVGPYDYAELGYNYRMTDVLAAIGLEQLKRVIEFNEARQRNAKLFDEGLKTIKGLVTPKTKGDRSHVYHQYTIRITPEFKVSREKLIEKLKALNIGSGIYYPKPLHLIPHIAKFGFSEGDFPEAERASHEVLSLPVHPGLDDADINRIIAAIKEVANG